MKERSPRRKGSRLLGEELRRLRGGRRLADITELTRDSPLASRIRPVSVPTLSQLENGDVLPNVETLYALAIVHQVSPGSLLSLVAEERLITGDGLPEDHDETKRRIEPAMNAGRWHEGLALAIHGERGATCRGEVVPWRAYRALALAKLGMRDDAAMLLHRCAIDPDLPASLAHVVQRFLAIVLADGGYLAPASFHAAEALRLAPAALAPAQRVALLQTRVFLLLARVDAGESVAESDLGAARRWIAEARDLAQPPSDYMSIFHDLQEARLHEAAGNHPVAARDYRTIAERAARADELRLEGHAWHALGALRRRQSRMAEARTCLQRAESRALESGQHGETFDACFELYQVNVALGDHGASSLYFKRCERYLPLLQSMTPGAVRFASLLRGGREA